MRFVDSNIFLRHLTQDVPVMAADCTALLREIEQGRLQAWTNDLVIAEVVFVLESAAGAGYRNDAHLRWACNDAQIEASIPPELYSYDRHYDRLQTVKRILPSVR